jgi:alpha-methylacyl-CoA racemase
MHLADLGADVIKIEDTGAGDYARSAGAVHGDISYFQLVNRNKRSLTLDLKQAAGVDAFMRLAAQADVILEGFRPGVVDKLGIGYQAGVVDQSTHRLLCDHRLRAGWAVP